MISLIPEKGKKSKIGWIEDLFKYGDALHSLEQLDDQHTQFHNFSDMPKSSVIIFQTLSFFLSFLTYGHLNSQLMTTTCLTHLTLTSVQHVEGFLHFESFFTDLWLSLNLLFYSKTCVYNIISSPCLYWCFTSTCDGVSSTRQKNSAERPEKKEV